jgi:D-alanyl-lipoteichoic acid acyltransferase DltB (MBOAT superfamily)
LDSASIQFVLYGLAAALISNVSRSRSWRATVLFLASIVFLALLSRYPPAFLPLAGFLVLGYAALLAAGRFGSRWLVAGVLAVIFAYAWLKKYTVLPEATFLQFPYLTVGLSYIFFRVLHLIIDTGDGERRYPSPGAYLLYTLNFTTLVSGPIQRYEDFSRDQFAAEPIELGPRVVGLQLERIVRGFFKVNILAMLLQAVQQDAVGQLVQLSPPALKVYAALRLAVVYPLFLYANFSGYIDIVIAMARLMRVRLPENFDRPFSASSVLDFWNRWHMTLSNWLKTYVYNPLLIALMRRIPAVEMQPLLGVFCFFATFFLIGVWHGRTSEFVMFGFLTGSGMSINKLWQLGLTRAKGRKGYQALAKNSAYGSFGRGLNYVWFSFTLFWFWNDWAHLGGIFRALPAFEWIGVWLTAWVAATVVLAAWEWLRPALLSIKTAHGPLLTSRYARVIYASALGLTAFVISILLSQAAPDIVYKAF